MCVCVCVCVCVLLFLFFFHVLMLSIEFRMTLAASFVNTAQRHGLPVPSKKLFHDLSVVPFLTEMVSVELVLSS